MRRNNNKGNVRTITTGHIEGDMLGQVYLWISERKNRKYAQRPHRTYQRKSNIRVVSEWFQTAPTALLRKFQAWQDKKDAQVPRYLSGVRKQKRNGK